MNSRCTVFVSDDVWRVACVDTEGVRLHTVECAGAAELAVKAQAVAQTLASLNAAGPVVVALPSAWCLCAVVDGLSVPRSSRVKALAYLLEEHLPISAEESVADFIGAGREVLGVAAPLVEIEKVVESLESCDVRVAHLCPSALLLAQKFVKESDGVKGVLATQPVTEGIEPKTYAADLIELHHGEPRRWQWWADASVPISEHLAEANASDQEGGRWVVSGEASAVHGIEAIHSAEQGPEQAAAKQAAAILDGDSTAWIDLRRGPLAASGAGQRYRKPLGLFVAAIMVLLVSVIVATAWRGTAYQRLADEAVSQQRAAFEEVLPGQRVPGSIRRRLQSERQTLAGLGGRAPVRSDLGEESLYPTSALTHLNNVLTALPQDVRYQVSDLAIEPGLVRVDGKAESHVVAEQIAGALRRGGRYEAAPPNSRALRDFGVSFGFTARPQPETNPNQEASP